MTGELSIRGKVRPVGGVIAKVQAAKTAGIKKVVIPRENWQELFEDAGIEVIPVEEISQVIDIVLKHKTVHFDEMFLNKKHVNVLSASGGI